MSQSRVGTFRDRVRIEANKSSDHDPEEQFVGNTFLDSWPCKIHSVAGFEQFRGRTIDAEVNYVVEGWYVDGVLPNMRAVVTCGIPIKATLNIKYVKHTPQTNGKPALTELHCVEVVGL